MDVFEQETSQIPRAQARSRGLSLYYTGKPCCEGHTATRRVCNGVCLDCETTPRAKAANVAHVAQWRKAQAELDPVAFRAKRATERRTNRKRNPETAKAAYKRSREKNKAWYQAYMKQWRAENRQRLTEYDNALKQAWRDANPEAARIKGRLAAQRRRATIRAAEGSFTFEDIERLMGEQGGICAGICGGSIRERYEIDHKVPLFRGGTHWPFNIQLMCRGCNAKKQARTMEEWLSSMR